MTKKDYRDYIEDIITSIDEIAEFIGTMTFDDFINDRKTSNAVVRSMEIIGEAAKNVPVILREKYNSVPWKKMAGMRDKLIHEYSGVDLEIVWQAIKQDLPSVKPLIVEILKELEHSQ